MKRVIPAIVFATVTAATALSPPALAFTPTEEEIDMAVFIYSAAICAQKVDPTHEDKWRGGFIVELSKELAGSWDRVWQIQEHTPRFYRRVAILIDREGGCEAMVEKTNLLNDDSIAPKPPLAGKTEEDSFDF